MKMRAVLVSLLLGSAVQIAHAEQWELVLLKPRGCDACVYVEEILKRSAQMQQAVLEDGAGSQATARIVRRNSAELSAQEWGELRALPGFDEPQWRQKTRARAALVLLKRDDAIVSAGDIADSAISRGAQLPANITTPDAGRDFNAVRNARAAYITDLNLRSWNLNWFYRLALNPSLQRTGGTSAWIAANTATLSPPLGAANVILMSTASGAADNEIFNALRIEEIRDVLAQALQLDPKLPRIFYGGDNAYGANALEVRDGRIGLVRRDVAGSKPFTPDAAVQIFQAIRARPASRNLLVLVGHGAPDGAGMWGSPVSLSPATLSALHAHSGGDNVLVSGNCFGGVMARAMSCGFFGARPDIIATGCQADAAQVAQSRDYLHMYFDSLTPAARRVADADANGSISFAEAHWYASTEGDPRNVTYTSIDALADAWFDTHPDTLPPSLAVGEIRALSAGAPPAEAQAVQKLLLGYQPDVALPLEDLAGQAEKWTPESGRPRAMVGQLARRLLFQKSKDANRAELGQLQSCENRAIEQFLAQ